MSNIALPVILSVAFGVAATAFFYEKSRPDTSLSVMTPQVSPVPTYAKNESRVYQEQDLYVFINAEPLVKYRKIDVVNQDVLKSLIDAGKNKSNWDALLDIGRQTFKEITLSERLKKMAEAAKAKNQQAEGIIFRDNLTSCDVIIFE